MQPMPPTRRGPGGSPGGSTDREIVRQQRRLILETRTLTITLRSAIADMDADPTLTDAERTAARREWCERVRVLLQDVRARSMQLATLTEAGLGALRPDEVVAADDRPDAVLDEAERDIAAIADDVA